MTRLRAILDNANVRLWLVFFGIVAASVSAFYAVYFVARHFNEFPPCQHCIANQVLAALIINTPDVQLPERCVPQGYAGQQAAQPEYQLAKNDLLFRCLKPTTRYCDSIRIFGYCIEYIWPPQLSEIPAMVDLLRLYQRNPCALPLESVHPYLSYLEHTGRFPEERPRGKYAGPFAPGLFIPCSEATAIDFVSVIFDPEKGASYKLDDRYWWRRLGLFR